MADRRLPVYLLLDCSESMAGTAIEEVQRGVETLVSTLRTNPLALETAYLSVITFSRLVKQEVPLTELLKFQLPKLSVRPGTSFGTAIQLLLKCLHREIVKSTPTTRGDYKPLVFILTDGQPTDEWEAAVDALRVANNPRLANIYAIGCGPDVDTGVLHRMTDIVLNQNDLSPDGWRKMFVWLSASINSASTRLAGGATTAAIDMPPLPEGLTLDEPDTCSPRDATPRQVFLHAKCSRQRKPYLMRFARQGYGGRYVAITSHPLEEFDDGDFDVLPPINSSMLDGCPPCPYCGNPTVSLCPCGAMFCDTGSTTGTSTCPTCNAQLSYGGSGNFDIQRSHG